MDICNLELLKYEVGILNRIGKILYLWIVLMIVDGNYRLIFGARGRIVRSSGKCVMLGFCRDLKCFSALYYHAVSSYLYDESGNGCCVHF
jgi:hypothetical protein